MQIPADLLSSPAVQTVLLLLLCSAVGTLFVKLWPVPAIIKLILTNHLPHMQAEISELRQMLVEHIDSKRK